jgi:hypothetical protein
LNLRNGGFRARLPEISDNVAPGVRRPKYPFKAAAQQSLICKFLVAESAGPQKLFFTFYVAFP